MNTLVTYEELLSIVGQGQKTLDELITYLLHKRAAPKEAYGANGAFVVVLADVLIALGLPQLSVISFLQAIDDPLIEEIKVIVKEAHDTENGACCTMQIRKPIIQILEGRWILFPGQHMYDLEMRTFTPGSITPTLSTALNVPVLWLRTMPKLLGLDSVAARGAAVGVARASAPSRTS